MDEISKLVFGCVALVGLVVMVIPNSDPLASGNAVKPVESAAIPPPPNIAPAASVPPAPMTGDSSGGSSSSFVVEDYNIGKFGDPMVDPTPAGQRNSNVQQQSGGVPPPPNYQGETPPPQTQSIPQSGPGIPVPPPPMVIAN